MRTLITIFAAAMILMMIAACEETVTQKEIVEKSELNPPLGLRSITGDTQVTLRWYSSNYEDDFGGYLIYQATGNYERIAPETMPSAFTVADTVKVDLDGSPPTVHTILGLENGYPSNIVTDTPRPFGTATIYQQEAEPDQQAGFDFSEGLEVPYLDSDCDIFLDVYTIADNLHYSLTSPDQASSALRTTEIQDMGYTDSFDQIDISPEEGWDPDYSVDVLDMVNHTFALKTEDDNFVKLRVLSTSLPSDDPAWVRFEYGYQTISGDPNFKTLP
jgi:hypothetical protein